MEMGLKSVMRFVQCGFCPERTIGEGTPPAMCTASGVRQRVKMLNHWYGESVLDWYWIGQMDADDTPVKRRRIRSDFVIVVSDS
jgi:hypothetical protein